MVTEVSPASFKTQTQPDHFPSILGSNKCLLAPPWSLRLAYLHSQPFEQVDSKLVENIHQVSKHPVLDNFIAFTNPDIYTVNTDPFAGGGAIQVLTAVGGDYTGPTAGAHITAFGKQRIEILHLTIRKGVQPVLLMINLKFFEAVIVTDATGAIPLHVRLKEFGHTHAVEYRLIEAIEAGVDHFSNQIQALL